MSFFGNDNRFKQRNHMSPGPATYRLRNGFDAVHWERGSVRSPQFVREKRRSLQLSACSSSIMDFSINEKISPLDQEMIMKELYGRYIQIMHIDLKDIKKENEEKSTNLNFRDRAIEQELEVIRPDTPEKVGEAILKGDVLVKVLRVPTGKHLGPGVYNHTTRKQPSHNIKASPQYRSLCRKKSKNNASRIGSSCIKEVVKKFTFGSELLRKSPPKRNISKKSGSHSSIYTTKQTESNQTFTTGNQPLILRSNN